MKEEQDTKGDKQTNINQPQKILNEQKRPQYLYQRVKSSVKSDDNQSDRIILVNGLLTGFELEV